MSENDHGQRLGRPVDWTPATPPEKATVLEGKGVRLEPVAPQQQPGTEYQATAAADGQKAS